MAVKLIRLVGKPTMWFPNMSDTNRPVQAQKTDRSLKSGIKVEEELYYPSTENKGADQLHGHREADLRLCFRLCRLLFFSRGGSNNRPLKKVNSNKDSKIIGVQNRTTAVV